MRGNLTFKVDSLFRWSVLTISYTKPLYTKFKNIFSKRMISNYTIKSPMVNIQLLIDIITVTGAPKRYILDKTDKGFTNIPLMS